MDDRWDAAIQLLYAAGYVVVIATMVVMAVPPLRAGLGVGLGAQVHAWRYGRWLAGRTPAPAWTRQLARDDLPAERT